AGGAGGACGAMPVCRTTVATQAGPVALVRLAPHGLDGMRQGAQTNAERAPCGVRAHPQSSALIAESRAQPRAGPRRFPDPRDVVIPRAVTVRNGRATLRVPLPAPYGHCVHTLRSPLGGSPCPTS